jgi:hypothetical protein
MSPRGKPLDQQVDHVSFFAERRKDGNVGILRRTRLPPTQDGEATDGTGRMPVAAQDVENFLGGHENSLRDDA